LPERPNRRILRVQSWTHVTNRLIREALHPYPNNLVIVTKVGAVRGDASSWIPALTAADLTRGVHDNLRNLAVDVLDVLNLRVGGVHGPSDGSIAEQFTTFVTSAGSSGKCRQLA
jgi:pyridoxine 4-dehydrogenase